MMKLFSSVLAVLLTASLAFAQPVPPRQQGSSSTATENLDMIGCVRADTAAVDAGVADGDRVRCIVDATGKIWVNVGTVPVTGPVTDAQLRATPVPVDTELGAAAAAADAAANPTAPIAQAFLSAWNGTGWDRLRSTIANGLVVDVSRVLGTVTIAGSVTANAGTNLNTSALALDATLTGRLPAGASPADNESNTNTSLSRIGNFNFIFDGTAWDRWTGQVTLGAETTKVIGTVRVQGNLGAAFDAATGAAPPANAILMGGIVSGATGGFVGGIPISDTQAVVNISTATTTLIVTGVSGRHVRIGAFSLVTAAANNVAFISGTGATCGTGTAGMSGGTTAASGYNLAANGGIAHGTGLGTVLKTIAAGDSVCLVTSAATQLSGSVQYTIY